MWTSSSQPSPITLTVSGLGLRTKLPRAMQAQQVEASDDFPRPSRPTVKTKNSHPVFMHRDIYLAFVVHPTQTAIRFEFDSHVTSSNI